jgi:hypothetical protein
MSTLNSLLTPAVMFFALGVGAEVLRADLKFPPDLVKALSIYLLVGIVLSAGQRRFLRRLSGHHAGDPRGEPVSLSDAVAWRHLSF